MSKAISVYDMAVSDGLHGTAQRYVCRRGLEAMLEHEYAQLEQELGSRRGDTSNFTAKSSRLGTKVMVPPG